MRKLSEVIMRKMDEIASELERLTLHYIVTKHNRNRKRNPKLKRKWRLIVILATVMNVQNKSRSNMITFDTDSVVVGIDNLCSACISHVPEDLVGDLVDNSRVIKGFAGTRTLGIKVGTLRWS